VVDVFDALLNKRPYKEPWELSETLDYIRSRAGSQFDPVVVNALCTLVEENRLPFELYHRHTKKPPLTAGRLFLCMNNTQAT
jgi:HD-GYP domain-containing protein (c-di-GMP phosphodiesterase class II)